MNKFFVVLFMANIQIVVIATAALIAADIHNKDTVNCF